MRSALVMAVLVVALCLLSVPYMAESAPTPGPVAPMDMHAMQNISAGQRQPGENQSFERSLALLPDSAPASPVNGTAWSIFNHRGSGFLILLWGLTAFIAGLQWPRRTWLRFVPPLALLGLVEFLILRNDPKAWPSGPIGFWISNQDPATLQHRVFVVLVLAIAVVELFRAADRLPPLLRVYALPALAVSGAIYLFFHKHGGLALQQMMQSLPSASATADPAMKEMISSMNLVKREHLWFSVCGFGLATAKLLADGGVLKGRLGATLWTVFAIALGAYMLGYTE